jgi:hypothetical protein
MEIVTILAAGRWNRIAYDELLVTRWFVPAKVRLSARAVRPPHAKEEMVTKTAAKKQWHSPKLVHLGRIADVAGAFGVTIEGTQHVRS